MLSVDESMIPFKGRNSLKQYMSMKPIKYSISGYISKFQIYSCREKNFSNIEIGQRERVVLEFTEHLKGRNCLTAFDIFFTSVSVLEKLHEKET